MNPAERLAQRMKEAGHSSVSKVANVAKRASEAFTKAADDVLNII